MFRTCEISCDCALKACSIAWPSAGRWPTIVSRHFSTLPSRSSTLAACPVSASIMPSTCFILPWNSW